MLFTSRKGRWVFAVPFFMLAWTAFLVFFAIHAWHGVLYVLLPLVVIVTIGGFRWVRRVGSVLETWEPELWAPFRRRRMKAHNAHILVKTTIGRMHGYDLAVRDEGAHAEICTVVITYMNKQRVMSSSIRAGSALDLTTRDETIPDSKP